MATTNSPAPALKVNLGLSEAEWLSDLKAFKNRVEAIHPKLEGKVRSQFESGATQLQEALPRTPGSQVLVGLMRLTASLQDGHTTLSPAMQSGLRLYPLRFQLLDGALYLTGADKKYRNALGGRLLAINNTKSPELIWQSAAITSGDNVSSVNGRLGINLVSPDVLAGLGIIRAPAKPPTYTLVVRGQIIQVKPLSVAAQQQHPSSDAKGRYSNSWVDLGPKSVPTWLSRRDAAYWWDYQPATDTIYAQYNRADSDPADPMPDFARRLRKEIDTRKPARVILDLRHNSGGEAFWNKPLLLALLHSDFLEQPNKLFVLIGRDTFSAGTLLAIDLEKYSNAVFVGEPTGGAIQNFGNHELVRLPNSGLTALVATKYYQNNGPNDERPWVAPKIAADLTPQDLATGRDPAMEAVLAYRAPDDVLKAAVLAAPSGAAADAARRVTKENIYRYLDTEPLLTGVGYQLLKTGEVDRAVALMQVAVEQNPQKANAYDSLGDAYRAQGKLDAAIVNYRKALEIAPDWVSARRSLESLGIVVTTPHH